MSDGSVASAVRELFTFRSTTCSVIVAATSAEVCSSIARVSTFLSPVSFSGGQPRIPGVRGEERWHPVVNLAARVARFAGDYDEAA